MSDEESFVEAANSMDLSDLMSESSDNSRDISEVLKEYLESFGLPKGSLKDDDVLEELAKNAGATYEDVDELHEAVEKIMQSDSLISEAVENNLKYFGDE